MLTLFDYVATIAISTNQTEKQMQVASHYEVIINFEAVASFIDRFGAAAFVRSNGGFIRLVKKTIQRPTCWWVQQ